MTSRRLSLRSRRLIGALASFGHRPRQVRARSERLAAVAVDASGAIRRGAVVVAGERLTIRLPHRTYSPNRGAWGGHWSGNDAEKRAWAARLEAAVDASTPAVRRLAKGSRTFPTPARRCDWIAPVRRLGAPPVPVTARRVLESSRMLIADFDNLAFSFKGLFDAVVRAGFLLGDSMAEIAVRYEQVVGLEGLDWTEIEIDATGRPADEGI